MSVGKSRAASTTRWPARARSKVRQPQVTFQDLTVAFRNGGALQQVPGGGM